MRTNLALAALLGLAVATPALAQAPAQTTGQSPSQGGPRDVGNMAYPTPLPQGNLGTTMPGRTSDTSSAAFPTPLPQGTVGQSTASGARTPSDTGSMAYPTPAPQGTAGTTGTK